MPVLYIVITVTLAVMLIDAVQYLFHLTHILTRAVIQGFLHHQLLRTLASEGLLQGTIAVQTCIDFYQLLDSANI